MTNAADEREKLLRARAEITEVLTRYELVGHVAMAGQLGLSEALMHLEAPWCNAFVEETPKGHTVRLRSMRVDYPNRDAKREHLESTLSALGSIGELGAMVGLVLLNVTQQFSEHVGATQTPLTREHKQ